MSPIEAGQLIYSDVKFYITKITNSQEQENLREQINQMSILKGLGR